MKSSIYSSNLKMLILTLGICLPLHATEKIVNQNTEDTAQTQTSTLKLASALSRALEKAPTSQPQTTQTTQKKPQITYDVTCFDQEKEHEKTKEEGTKIEAKQLIISSTDLFFCEIKQQELDYIGTQTLWLYDTVNKYIAQHFDAPTMGRYVIGRYWRNIKDKKLKEQFTDGFQKRLIRTYAKLFLKVKEPKVEIIPTRKKKKDKRALVSTNVLFDNSSPIKVEYSLRKKKDKWLIYNVHLEGVSLLKAYRNEYIDIIAKKKDKESIDEIMKTFIQNLKTDHENFINKNQLGVTTEEIEQIGTPAPSPIPAK